MHTNAREVIDNNVDMAHFFYVHKSFPTYFKNVFEGHVAAQYMNGLAREDVRPPADEGAPGHASATPRRPPTTARRS